MIKYIKEAKLRRLIRSVIIEVQTGGVSTEFSKSDSGFFDDNLSTNKKVFEKPKVKKLLSSNNVEKIRLTIFKRNSDNKSYRCIVIEGNVSSSPDSEVENVLIPFNTTDEKNMSRKFNSLSTAFYNLSFESIYDRNISDFSEEDIIYPISFMKSISDKLVSSDIKIDLSKADLPKDLSSSQIVSEINKNISNLLNAATKNFDTTDVKTEKKKDNLKSGKVIFNFKDDNTSPFKIGTIGNDKGKIILKYKQGSSDRTKVIVFSKDKFKYKTIEEFINDLPQVEKIKGNTSLMKAIKANKDKIRPSFDNVIK